MCLAVKKCTFCNIFYPISLFSLTRVDSNKFKSRCKLCCSGLSRERRLNNPKPKSEAKKLQEKEWYLNNKKKRKDYLKKYNLKNKQRIAEKRINKKLSENKYSNVLIKSCPTCDNISCISLDRAVCSSCYRNYWARISYIGRQILKGEVKCEGCIKSLYPFEKYSIGTTYCTKECANNKRREKANAYKRNYTTIRTRDRLNKNDCFTEVVKRNKVFLRDNYRCNNCGVKVQRKDYNADNSGELDHVIPISLRGSHSYFNLQILCRKCNHNKSNKIIHNKLFTLTYVMHLIFSEGKIPFTNTYSHKNL